MRVLVLPSFYPTRDDPNRGIFFKEQSSNCVSVDLEIDILYNERRSLKKIFSRSSWINYFQICSGYENNLFVYRRHSWNLLPTKTRVGQKIWAYFSYKLFERYIKDRGQPDIIHVQSAFYAGEVANKIFLKYKIPYLIQEHSTLVVKTEFNYFYKHYFRAIYFRAKKIVSVSNKLKMELVDKFDIPDSSISVIHNFVDTDFFSPEAPLLSTNQKPAGFLFFALSFLNSNKRVDRLIRCFGKAFENIPDVFLYVGGKGEEMTELKSLISQLGLTSKIRLLGELNRVHARDWLNLCDSFVLPSDIETFGVVLIEALSMGKPVIATRCGGPEDIVTDSVGMLIDRTEVEIILALQTMFTKADQYDAAFIRNYAIDNFSVRPIAPQLINLYNAI